MATHRVRSRWTSVAGRVVLALGVAATLPLPAHAATVSATGGTLAYRAAPGELNVVDITRFSSPYVHGISVFEDAAVLRARRGCRLTSPRHAVCLRRVRALRADLGDGSDLLSLRVRGVRATVVAGDGADLVETGSRADTVDAGPGTDTIVGRAGDDTIAGGDGGDLLQGSGGGDAVAGQAGDDVAEGQAGSGDALFGGLGRDLLLGGPGKDALMGNGSGDALYGGQGEDRLEGGTGDDQITDADASSAVVDCGPGDDRVRVRGDDVQLVNCAGARNAPWGTPSVWPPREDDAAAQIPPAKPKVLARPRLSGRATYVTVRVVDDFFYKARVRVVFFSRSGRRLGRREYDATTRNPLNLYRPRPPRRAYRARGRCCF